LNVNVVYHDKGANNVLDRQAQALSAAAGWNYTDSPTGKADLTHFICYVEYGERFSDWHVTPVSAWFTHKEADREWKLFWWELAAQNVDLRITAARLYLPELEFYGPAALCDHPALDGQFVVGEKQKNERLKVGVSGFVHPGGRKGEKLVARLAGSKLGKHVELVGSGRGWPCPTRLYNWDELPGWYNSLDLLLCTSSVEGVPMPPLEALACGTPVVVPEGVGLLDDLEGPGVYRYPAGDFDRMQKAVERALKAEHDPQNLAAGVAGYSASAWAEDHKRAFLDLKAQAHVESDRHGKRGVIYVAYGEPSRRCAKGAIESFRRHMPGVEVGLIGSEPLGSEDVFIRCDDVDIGGRHAKTRIYELAPRDWQYVMYLDSDTEVCTDISFLFNVLMDGWDMVIAKNPVKYHLAWQMKRSDNHDECDYTFDQLGTGELIQLNGGVFAFQRNERTANFFHAWHVEWNKWGKRDQGALLRALFTHPLKLYVLENYPWNAITRYEKRADVCIKHYPMTARRWRGKVYHRSDSQEAWSTVRAHEEREGLKVSKA